MRTRYSVVMNCSFGLAGRYMCAVSRAEPVPVPTHVKDGPGNTPDVPLLRLSRSPDLVVVPLRDKNRREGEDEGSWGREGGGGRGADKWGS